MTVVARNWLPEGALTLEALEVALAEVLEGWGGHWFESRDASLCDFETGAAAPIPDAGGHNALGDHVTAIMSGRLKRQMIEAALDVKLAAYSAREHDHRLLEAFSDAVIDDLVTRLDTKISQLGSRSHGDRIVKLGIAVGGVEMLPVYVDEQHLIAALRTYWSKTKSPCIERIHTRTAALRTTKLRLEGVLGRAVLSLAEIEHLASGDVLVLDRNIDEPVDLCAAGQSSIVRRGRLYRTDEKLEVHIEA